MLSLRKEIESKKQSKILFLRIIKSSQIVRGQVNRREMTLPTVKNYKHVDKC